LLLLELDLKPNLLKLALRLLVAVTLFTCAFAAPADLGDVVGDVGVLAPCGLAAPADLGDVGVLAPPSAATVVSSSAFLLGADGALEAELEEESTLALSSTSLDAAPAVAVAAGALSSSDFIAADADGALGRSGNFVAGFGALEGELEAPAVLPLPSLDAAPAVAVAAVALDSGNFVSGFSASACVVIGVRGDLGLTSRS